MGARGETVPDALFPAGEEDAGGSARESRYRAACRACGVTPASALLRRTAGPLLSLRHRGLGPRVRDGSTVAPLEGHPPRGSGVSEGLQTL